MERKKDMREISSANGTKGDEIIYPKSQELSKEIFDLCIKSGLSYLEQNKALYIADRGLYERAIKNSSKTEVYKN